MMDPEMAGRGRPAGLRPGHVGAETATVAACRSRRGCSSASAAVAVPVTNRSWRGRSGGRNDHAELGRRGRYGPAVGQQRAAVIEDHHAVAQQAPALFWMTGYGPCPAAIMCMGARAWRPMRALLLPGPLGAAARLDGCHGIPSFRQQQRHARLGEPASRSSRDFRTADIQGAIAGSRPPGIVRWLRCRQAQLVPANHQT